MLLCDIGSASYHFLNENQAPSKLIINDIELTDIELLFTYNSTYQMTITIYDKIRKTNKKILRSGSNHTKAFHQELSFIIKTMVEFPDNIRASHFMPFESANDVAYKTPILNHLMKYMEKEEEQCH